jgi:predicted nucleic acid-binding protein
LGICLPFSDIDIFLKKADASNGCVADTSFLIAASDEEHHFSEDAQFIFGKLVEYKIPIYVSVSARSEYVDFIRRLIVTEALMDMLVPASKWKISSSVRDTLKSQRGWIDNRAKQELLPYLNDSRIKLCKQSFLPRNQSGQVGWIEFCNEFLKNRLLTAWNDLVELLELNYVDMRADGTPLLFRKELQWDEMYKISEQSALGSNDSMILNLLNSSVFPFVITSDFDLAYGVLASTQDKVAFVPDNLYRNRLKKLKF